MVGEKYHPLRDLLLRQPGDTLRLSFAESEAVLGAPLPRSAHEHPEWWSAQKPHRSQDFAWSEAGWTVETADRQAKIAPFRRLGR